MDVDLRLLRYFCVVAEEPTLTAAAARLGIAQPPLSRAMSRLERQVGVPLLHRHGRGVVLTDAGQRLHHDATELLARAQEAIRGAGDAGRARRRLNVGVLSGIAPVLAPVVRRLLARHPGMVLAFHQLDRGEQLSALRRGVLGVALVRGPVEPAGLPRGLQGRVLLDEPMAAAVAPDHPIAGRRSVSLAQLGDEEWLLPADLAAPETADLVDRCRAAGFVPRTRPRGSGCAGAAVLAAAGAGVWPIPVSVRDEPRLSGALRLVPIEGYRSAVVAVTASSVPPAAAAFLRAAAG